MNKLNPKVEKSEVKALKPAERYFNVANTGSELSHELQQLLIDKTHLEFAAVPDSKIDIFRTFKLKIFYPQADLAFQPLQLTFSYNEYLNIIYIRWDSYLQCLTFAETLKPAG